MIHYHSRNDFEEMDQVIGNIKKLRAVQGFRYSDFAVIYRSGFLSRVVEKKLVEKIFRMRYLAACAFTREWRSSISWLI